MSEAESGNTVKVHYTGTLTDGTTFDSSTGGDPLEVVLGDGKVIPGFEQAVMGMAVGETKTVTIPAAEAYGVHHADRVHQVEREKIPPDVDLEVGRVLEAVGAEGVTLAVVVAGLTDTMVTLDFNHPLAGKDLTFELELVEIA
jgi:FKBP-type peptidyl-prolyl cis-trans isomerase 2